MGDSIEVRLRLDDIDVVEAKEVDGHLEVLIRSTLKPCCMQCGSVDVFGHGRNRRRIRDRPCGQPVVLVWDQRRVRCRDCGASSRERHPMVAGPKRATVRFRRQLFEEACERPYCVVARDHAVSHWRVLDAFDDHAEAQLASQPLPRPRVISLDESSFLRPFRFATVLFAPEARMALAMAMGRDRTAATAALESLGPEALAGIEAAVIDLHWPFRQALELVLPNATIVADRFHVQRAVDRAAHKVRTRVSRQPVPVGPRSGRAVPRTRSRRYDAGASLRWAFSRRASALDPRHRAVLEEFFATHPEAAVAWLMKESFAAIYEAADRAEAERRLEVWVDNLPAAGLPELRGTWIKLVGWREPILNYFDHRHTNAFAEGMTNKIKVIKRQAYGFRNLSRYRAKVLLCCQPRSA